MCEANALFGYSDNAVLAQTGWSSGPWRSIRWSVADGLAGAPILLDLVGNRLALLQGAQASTLGGGNVDEDVAAAIA